MAKSGIEIDIHIGVSDMGDLKDLLIEFTDSVCEELCDDIKDKDDFCEKFIVNKYKIEIESMKRKIEALKKLKV